MDVLVSPLKPDRCGYAGMWAPSKPTCTYDDQIHALHCILIVKDSGMPPTGLILLYMLHSDIKRPHAPTWTQFPRINPYVSR